MTNKTDKTDRELRTLLKSSNFTALPSPWFTRKVMNRLPRKRARNLAWIEYGVYLTAAILIAIIGTGYAIDSFRSGFVTIGNITAIGLCIGVFCATLYLMVSPWIKARFTE